MISGVFKESVKMSFIRRPHAAAFVCFAALIFVFGYTASAQTFRGTILGTVTDTSDAAIAGATVTVKNTGTGLTRIVSTAEDGSYAVPELPIGTYSVTVTITGFKSGVVSGLQVEVSSEVRADVKLQAGDIAQRIEVQGDTLPQVDTTENTLGGIIESKVVTNLPVNGRDYQKLIYLVPGVTGSPDQITDSPGSFGTFSVNGARGRSNNFLLDGTDMNDGYRNDPAINEAGVFGTPATILPLEAIAELRVLSNFEAEYGRSAGGVINIVTKSGANDWHGSAFDYFRNTALNARNFFNTVNNTTTGGTNPQDPFHDNQFGAALGGALIKDKTFFYVDYEGVREKGSESSLACVPTATDIALATPAGGVNPVIASLISAGKAWPTPNISGSCIGGGGQSVVADNASLATPFSNRVDSAIVKIDHQLNANNLLTGRYYIGDSLQLFPLALTGGGLLPNYDTSTPTRVQLISISYVSTLSPAVTNEVRLGWNRFAEGFFPQDRSFNPTTIGLDNVPESFGGTNTLAPYNFGLPTITVGPFAQLGADKGDPRQRVDTNWHYIDNISWKAGKHDIKFGYEFRRTSVSQIFNRTARGTLKFASLDAFLAGTPDGGSQIAGNTDRNTFENSHAAYIQDSYRWKRNVTINLGLRYDYFGIIQDKQGNFTNIDPNTGKIIQLGQGRLYQPDYNNWAPRVSAAWDISGSGKTVVRAGYGIFYDAFSQDLFEGHLPFNSSFDPGPAYNGYGPNPISFASASSGALTAGIPVYGFPSPMGDAFGVQQNIRTPYLQNFNLNLQQQLGRKTVLQVGYVGSNGHKLLRFRDINQPTLAMIQQTPYGPNSIAFDPSYNPTTNPNVPGCYCTPRPFSGFPFNYINYEESSANSNYNALQASLRVNDWHGLTSTLNYTWSHSIDDASDGEDYVPNAAQPDNSQAPIGSNRGNSNFDVRNRLTWNFIYLFPDRKGDWKRLTDGWGLNGIVTAQSGQPFQLNYNFEDDYNGTGEGFARPDVVAPVVYNQNDPRNYLTLSSFAVPCTLAVGTGAGNCQLINPATGAICTSSGIGPNCINSQHFGNEGRNSLIGPHFRQFDFSLFKDTVITEKLKLELRFEAYNLFNHPNFANPYLPLFIADAAPNGINANGTSVGTLALKTTGDVGIGYPVLGNGGPRSLQIAAKFTF
jgi:Carboxypeptidase regulatory-like domain/TonB-dependent Receptor Plug Domain